MKALVIDDEPDIRELINITLTDMGVDVTEAESKDAALRHLEQDGFDFCLTDLRLPDGDGIDIVQQIQRDKPEMPVAVITAFGTMDTAIAALKAGAFDFLSKPVKLGALRDLVKTATRKASPRAAGELERKLIGESEPMEQTRQLIRRVARTQAPVYIRGESGTGKELAARLIHDLGPRQSGPFVPVNCGAIPAELMESEFFGHRKGSFTGAQSDRDGLFHAANGGTLFLDEIADLPLNMQVKLLRAIQERAIRRIGDQRETPVDVRLISATHKNLEIAVSEERFRRDLFYRINVIDVEMPALRVRPKDISATCDHILKRICETQGVDIPKLGRNVVSALQMHDFPGNVRELENILERAVALSVDGQVKLDDLRLNRLEPATPDSRITAIPADLPAYLDEVERAAINAALEKSRFNKTAAAKLLGISFRALRYRLEKLGIDSDDDPVE